MGKHSQTIRKIRKLLAELGTHAENHRWRLAAPCQSICNVECLQVRTHSLEHLEHSTKGLYEVLHKGFIKGIKIGQFGVLRSLEDFQITLEWVAMAGK
jgi:hypothetical protein